MYDDAWFVVYNAEVWMRSEQVEWLRRRTERDHVAIRSAGSTSNYDRTKPWRTVFAMAVPGKVWCNDNLRRPDVLHLTLIKSAATAVEYGTVRPSGITQTWGPPAACRITTPPSRGGQCWRWPTRTKSGGMRTCTGPSSRPSLPWKMALHNPGAQLSNCARNRDPAHAAYASIRGSPRSPLGQSIHPKEENSAMSSVPRQVASRSASECLDIHASKVYNALDHGMENCSSTGSGTPPPPLPPTGKKK